MDVPWDEVTPIAWEKLARQRWAEERDSEGRLVAYTLLVPCPRCQHQDAIDLEFRLKILVDRSVTPPSLHPEIYPSANARASTRAPGGPEGCGARSSINSAFRRVRINDRY